MNLHRTKLYTRDVLRNLFLKSSFALSFRIALNLCSFIGFIPLGKQQAFN